MKQILNCKACFQRKPSDPMIDIDKYLLLLAQITYMSKLYFLTYSMRKVILQNIQLIS